MILGADQIADLLDEGTAGDDPLVITPQPDLDTLRESGSAAVDLRLGTWFLKLRESRIGLLKMAEPAELVTESRFAELHYVPFGEQYILHPRSFVLAATLEWIRFSKRLAGFVVGRSSWGRRGLIIATAIGVHPGFTGCLTLELSNVGELPLELKPGTSICQLFVHRVESESHHTDRTAFLGFRRPVLGPIKLDDVATKLGA